MKGNQSTISTMPGPKTTTITAPRSQPSRYRSSLLHPCSILSITRRPPYTPPKSHRCTVSAAGIRSRQRSRPPLKCRTARGSIRPSPSRVPRKVPGRALATSTAQSHSSLSTSLTLPAAITTPSPPSKRRSRSSCRRNERG